MLPSSKLQRKLKGAICDYQLAVDLVKPSEEIQPVEDEQMPHDGMVQLER
jgi:hypothetical protein